MEYRANILDVDKDGWSALMLATHIADNISTIETILKHSKKNIHHQSYTGLTALKIALYKKNRATIKVLIQNGALLIKSDKEK